MAPETADHSEAYAGPNAHTALDYATHSASRSSGLRWAVFVGGVVAGEVVSMLLLAILAAGGPIFPFTLLFAPMAVVVEMIGTDRALFACLLIGGPLLYGLYAWLLTLPNRLRTVSIAGGIHLLCFAVTLWQRAVFAAL
jgi:hypothetical protein